MKKIPLSKPNCSLVIPNSRFRDFQASAWKSALALPPMRWSHDHRRETYRRPIETSFPTFSPRSHHVKPQSQPPLVLPTCYPQALCTLRVLNPAIRFPPRPKTFLLHHATYHHNHLPSAFSSFSNCSRSFLLNPK